MTICLSLLPRWKLREGRELQLTLSIASSVLQEKMEKKKAGVKCHKCGEKGHYASTCKEKTVLSFSSSSSSSSSSNSQASAARQALQDLLKNGVDAEELALLAIELRGESSPVYLSSGAVAAAPAGGSSD